MAPHISIITRHPRGTVRHSDHQLTKASKISSRSYPIVLNFVVEENSLFSVLPGLLLHSTALWFSLQHTHSLANNDHATLTSKIFVRPMLLLVLMVSSVVATKRPVISIANPDLEVMDVTLSTFGHQLAFHIVHPDTSERLSKHNLNLKSGTPAPAPAPAPTPVPVPVPDPTPTPVPALSSSPSPSTKRSPIPPPQMRCISWRQTGNCDPQAEREPAHDLSCDSVVHKGSSGYCECEGGRKEHLSTCEHDSFTCQNICTGSHIPLPVDYTNIILHFQSSELFEEMKPSNVNAILSKNKPFYLIVLCNCEHDVLIDHDNPTEESNWPIREFDVRIRESGQQNDFSFVYVLPASASHFSLYEQYSIDRVHSHLIIDNIPNG